MFHYSQNSKLFDIVVEFVSFVNGEGLQRKKKEDESVSAAAGDQLEIRFFFFLFYLLANDQII